MVFHDFQSQIFSFIIIHEFHRATLSFDHKCGYKRTFVSYYFTIIQAYRRTHSKKKTFENQPLSLKAYQTGEKITGVLINLMLMFLKQ